MIGQTGNNRVNTGLWNLKCSGQFSCKNPVTDHSRPCLLKQIWQICSMVKMRMVDCDIVYLSKFICVKSRCANFLPCLWILRKKRVCHQNFSAGQLKLKALGVNPSTSQNRHCNRGLIRCLWRFLQRNNLIKLQKKSPSPLKNKAPGSVFIPLQNRVPGLKRTATYQILFSSISSHQSRSAG